MSLVPELIDALVGAFRAASGLPGVEVTDGPQVTDSAASDWLLVGFDGSPDGESPAASTTQSWADMSTRRGEQIALTVALVASRGDTDVRAARVRVYEMHAVVEALFRASPSLGLRTLQVAVGSSQLHQEQTQSGVQARLLLTLACDTLA